MEADRCATDTLSMAALKKSPQLTQHHRHPQTLPHAPNPPIPPRQPLHPPQKPPHLDLRPLGQTRHALRPRVARRARGRAPAVRRRGLARVVRLRRLRARRRRLQPGGQQDPLGAVRAAGRRRVRGRRGVAPAPAGREGAPRRQREPRRAARGEHGPRAAAGLCAGFAREGGERGARCDAGGGGAG